MELLAGELVKLTEHSGLSPETVRRRLAVVLDNLSTHSPGALYEAYPAPEARQQRVT